MTTTSPNAFYLGDTVWVYGLGRGVITSFCDPGRVTVLLDGWTSPGPSFAFGGLRPVA